MSPPGEMLNTAAGVEQGISPGLASTEEVPCMALAEAGAAAEMAPEAPARAEARAAGQIPTRRAAEDRAARLPPGQAQQARAAVQETTQQVGAVGAVGVRPPLEPRAAMVAQGGFAVAEVAVAERVLPAQEERAAWGAGGPVL